jgi:uncharacterized protein YlxW (UPF0749 family)
MTAEPGTGQDPGPDKRPDEGPDEGPDGGQGTGGQPVESAPADRDGTHRDATDAEATDGEAADGEAADGEAADGEAADGEAADGEATDGEATDGEAADGDATDGDATDREPGGPPPEGDAPAPEGTAPPRRRRRRDPLAAVLIGVLTLLLGFAFAVQVRSTDTDDQLAGAREEDLVRILDDLTAQEDRLRQEIADQRTALDQLGSSDSASAAALQEARQRAEALGILNGTVAAQGPGITMTIQDPQAAISSSVLLNAIEELRGAGAETMQVDHVRIGVSSAVTGTPGHLAIDGQALEIPYTFQVIGSPQDMATAMSIPGGVVSTVGGRGGSVAIVQSQQVVVDSLRPLDKPQYARPDGGN